LHAGENSHIASNFPRLELYDADFNRKWSLKISVYLFVFLSNYLHCQLVHYLKAEDECAGVGGTDEYVVAHVRFLFFVGVIDLRFGL